MSQFLYNLFLFLFRSVLVLISSFHSKARKLLKSKKNWEVPLTGLQEKARVRIWFHCASLGEFEQGRPVIEGIKRLFPDINIVVTFFSPSGYEVRKDYDQAEAVTYLPWDTRKNAKAFLDLVSPDIIVFVKYEFWRNFLHEASLRNIPAILISGIFRPSQLFFKTIGKPYREVLDYFEQFFVQNKESMELLKSIGITHTTLSGDTRFDRVTDIAGKAEKIELIEKFKDNRPVFIGGSVWKDDLDRIIPIINDPEIEMKYIIAPHEIKGREIENWRSRIHKTNVLYSEAKDGSISEDADVLIIDNVGMLYRLYRYGNFAFIGGAYGPGLHNTLEAVAAGIPVFFGNRNYKKYKEALDLIELKVGFSVETPEEIKHIILPLMSNGENYDQMCQKAFNYIKSNTGATEKIIHCLSEKIKAL